MGRSCRQVWEDFQTGIRLPCQCEGFAPVVSQLRDASFVDRELTDTLPPLRLA